MVTAYEPDRLDRPRTQMPERCPYSDPAGPDCRVGHHHWRERKTGPCYAIEVAHCRTHRRAFTLYPPGYRPYGREAVVLLAHDGSRLLSDEGGGTSAGKLEAEFAGGMFEAAFDAAAGRAWPRCSERYGDGGLVHYWSGQGRLLEQTMALVEVAPGLGGDARGQIADVLGVERMLLDEQAKAVRQAPGYRSRGLAVCEVLRAMPASKQRCQRLLEGGRVAGLWGVPWHFDSRRGALVRMPFRVSGPRAPPTARRRSRVSTKVGR